MAQTNSNDTHVLNNNTKGVVAGSKTPTSFVSTSTDPIITVLNGAKSTGGDGNTQNGDYTIADQASKFAGSTVGLFKDGYVNNSVNFLPTEGALRAGTTGEFNPAASATTGNYFNPASWTATPTVTGNASAFTLTDTNDGGKTVTLTETISGSPFTTGNGAVSEALTFRGTASDTFVIKHNVAVANVPATTNNNGGSALDVRNETYAETYVKSGVTSNYVENTAHKYAEVNGNQSLNDVRAETYVYKDAGLAITSTVKTTVADAAYINGVERIVESNVANYSYKSASGSVDYVVTDTRNLAQSDQRTYTNITVTNVAKFIATDIANKTTITASGIVTGTTTNLVATKFAPTNTPKFNVTSDHYTLDVKDFTVGDGFSNTLLSLVNNNNSTGNVFDSPLGNGNVPASFNKYVSVATDTLTGTQFADTILVKDVAGTVAGTFVGGNVDGGLGNDTITGSKGDDTISGGAGADSIVVTAGNDTINDFLLGTDALTVTKGTSTAQVTVNFTDGTAPVKYIVTANETADTVIPATTATAADLALIAGVKVANPFDFSDSTAAVTAMPTGVSTDGDDLMLGSSFADKLSGGKGNDTIKGGAGDDSLLNGNDGNDSVEGNNGNDVLRGNNGDDTLNGGAGNDTLNGGSGKDVLTGGAENDTFLLSSIPVAGSGDSTTITDFTTTVDKIDLNLIDANSAIATDQAFSSTILAGTAAFTAAGQLRFNATTNTLEGNTDAIFATTEFSVVLTGVSAVVATDFVL